MPTSARSHAAMKFPLVAYHRLLSLVVIAIVGNVAPCFHITPYFEDLRSQISYCRPQNSVFLQLRPQSSHLTPQMSYLKPHIRDLTPSTSELRFLRPHTSHFRSHTSDHRRHTPHGRPDILTSRPANYHCFVA